MTGVCDKRDFRQRFASLFGHDSGYFAAELVAFESAAEEIGSGLEEVDIAGAEPSMGRAERTDNAEGEAIADNGCD